MTGQVLTRVAYDGGRKVEFRAAVLAAATTQRPGAVRWTEVTVYRTQKLDEQGAHGIYVIAKVGRSILAHRRTCLNTDTRRLPVFRAAPDQGKRMGCLECNPQLDPPAPDVVIETDRNSLRQANGQLELERVLFPRGYRLSELIGMTGELVEQLQDSDPDFARYWDEQVVPALTKE